MRSHASAALGETLAASTSLSVVMTPLVVLVVDDNEFILSLVERILDGAGIAVLKAGSAEDARRLWRESPIPIDMLITDIEMPGQSGFSLAAELAVWHPELPVLFMSGNRRDDPRLANCRGVRRAFLEKPFTEQSLVAEVFELAATPIRRVARAAG